LIAIADEVETITMCPSCGAAAPAFAGKHQRGARRILDIPLAEAGLPLCSA